MSREPLPRIGSIAMVAATAPIFLGLSLVAFLSLAAGPGRAHAAVPPPGVPVEAFCADLVDYDAKTVQPQIRLVTYDQTGAPTDIAYCSPDPTRPAVQLVRDASACAPAADLANLQVTDQARWLKPIAGGGIEEVLPCLPDQPRPAILTADGCSLSLVLGQQDQTDHASQLFRMLDPATGATLLDCFEPTPPVTLAIVTKSCAIAAGGRRQAPGTETDAVGSGTAAAYGRNLVPCHFEIDVATDRREACAGYQVDQAAGVAYPRYRYVRRTRGRSSSAYRSEFEPDDSDTGGLTATPCLPDIDNALFLDVTPVAWHTDELARTSLPTVQWAVADGTNLVNIGGPVPYPAWALPWTPGLPERIRTGQSVTIGCAVFFAVREETTYTLPDNSTRRYTTKAHADADIESACPFAVF